MFINGKWEICCVEKAEHKYTSNIPVDNLRLIVEAKKLPHPYEKQNEKLYQWLGTTTWKYSSDFDITESDYAKESAVLFLEKIDTIADVLINGNNVCKCENYFSSYYFDIKENINVGKNKIEIIIYGSETEALKEAEKLEYPIPHSQYPVQSQHRNLIRKTQCHSGWDWGPCFMVSGIYTEPEIIFGDGVIIEGVITRISPISEIKDNCEWLLEADIHLHNALDKNVNINEIKISIDELGCNASIKNIDVKSGKDFVTIKLNVSGGKLWWPNGYGQQNLYKMKAEIDNDKYDCSIGLRDIKGRSLEDEYGKSLVFSVNGVDIFCKGGNWIPANCMPSLDSEDMYRHLLESMKTANMNMVRIWGGGQYEHDKFYDICDELGILIWHDFMFACSLYPTDKKFLKNVDDEVRYQLKRLSHHASIALWCGNNEDIGAINWYEESKSNPLRYIVDYDRLNEGIIGNAVKSLDKDRLWWPSSPCAGENDYSDAFHDDKRGDMHNWMVWHEGKPFESYLDVQPRFCSEFGFQSFPSMSTIHTYAEADEINPTSPNMLYHQRNPRGNQIIIETMARYFMFPFKDVADFIYLSQVQQAWAIRYAVDAWRSSRPICMGILYWQINDIWPVASWSSIEYSGHWKILHYEAKRFFEMLYGSLYIKEDKLLGFIINDNNFDIDTDIKITRMHFSGKLIETKELNMNVKKSSSTNILSESIDKFDRYNEFMLLEWKDKKEEKYNRSFSWLSLPRECNVEKSNIKYSVIKEASDICIVLETDKPSFYVTLEIETEEDKKLFSERALSQTREMFSDNNITLIANEKVYIKYYGSKTVEDINKSLIIKTLRDTY